MMNVHKTISFLLIYLAVGGGFLSSQVVNDSRFKSITLLCNESITYDYLKRSSGSEGCTSYGFIGKKHWFRVIGTGQTFRLKYEGLASSGPPFLFIYSSSCDNLICVDDHFDFTYYLETKLGIDYFLRFSSNKIYFDPSQEPGGTFSISSVCFDSDCPDSLSLHNIELKDSTFHALEHLSTDAHVNGQVILRSGNSITLGENFTIDQNSILQCDIAGCPN